MTVVLYRVDDRLIHGQVVVGWGQPLGATFIALVDDAVRQSEWEQSLYRMGVPDSVDVIFASLEEAVQAIPDWEARSGKGIVLVGSVKALARLVESGVPLERVNLGGVHHGPGRSRRLRYVYLTEEEAVALQDLERMGVAVTAQDVPTARAVPLRELI